MYIYIHTHCIYNFINFHLNILVSFSETKFGLNQSLNVFLVPFCLCISGDSFTLIQCLCLSFLPPQGPQFLFYPHFSSKVAVMLWSLEYGRN